MSSKDSKKLSIKPVVGNTLMVTGALFFTYAILTLVTAVVVLIWGESFPTWTFYGIHAALASVPLFLGGLAFVIRS